MSIQIDHKVPRWQGSSDEFENLQLAHRRCNMGKGGGGEKSPNQHVAHIRALLRNTLLAMTGDPAECLEYLSDALAKVDPLFVFLGKESEALAILDETVTRLHGLEAILGHTYLPLLAACQGKRAEVLCCLGRDNEASSASDAADQILIETYFATLS